MNFLGFLFGPQCIMENVIKAEKWWIKNCSPADYAMIERSHAFQLSLSVQICPILFADKSCIFCVLVNFCRCFRLISFTVGAHKVIYLILAIFYDLSLHVHRMVNEHCFSL